VRRRPIDTALPSHEPSSLNPPLPPSLALLILVLLCLQVWGRKLVPCWSSPSSSHTSRPRGHRHKEEESSRTRVVDPSGRTEVRSVVLTP